MKSKNIVVSGYPKSGTVWVTRLVAQLMDCPSKGFWGAEENVFASEGLERNSPYTCYQSHSLYSELNIPDKEVIHKIIYVIRDPRDIVVSGAYHFHFYHTMIDRFIRHRKIEHTLLGNLIKRIDLRLMSRQKHLEKMLRILQMGDSTYPILTYPWDVHIRSFMNEDVLLILYEDLLNDPFIEARKVLDYLGTEKPDEVIREDLQKQSFSLRKSEFKARGQTDRAKHLRSGTVGQWKDRLSERQNRELHERYLNLMERFNYPFEAEN